MEKRLDNIQNIKCLMMLTVVLYHSCMFFSGNWFDAVTPTYRVSYIATFAGWLNTFHVATFTMASGYLFYYLKSEKGRYATDVRLDLIKRAKRLLVPYFSACAIWVIPFYILYSGFDVRMIVHKYALGYAPSQLWFLLMLFWVFVFFRLLHERIPMCQCGICMMAALSIGGGYPR